MCVRFNMAHQVLTKEIQINFDWSHNHWTYDLTKIENSLAVESIAADPSDMSYLRRHLRELPSDARKYILWASFFGAT